MPGADAERLAIARELHVSEGPSHSLPIEADRDIRFLALTLGVPANRKGNLRLIESELGESVRRGLCARVDVLERVGDVDIQRQATAGTPPSLTILLEFPNGGSAAPALLDTTRSLLKRAWPGSRLIRAELLERAAGSGTALPEPLRPDEPRPARMAAAVEFIAIPRERLPDYREFMRTRFGPVGIELVRRGHCHRVIITETIEVLEHDPDYPSWNHVHILVGDFSDTPRTFIAPTEEILTELVGQPTSIDQGLAPVAGYRRKPFMTRNRFLLELPGWGEPGSGRL